MMSTADFSSTINFILPSESAQAVVAFLISNNIAFTLNPMGYSGCTPIMNKKHEGLTDEMNITDTDTIEWQGLENGEFFGGAKLNLTTIEAVY